MIMLYTLPNCHKCEVVKEFLKENNIEYIESTDMVEIRKLYPQIRANVNRDAQGNVIFPIIMENTRFIGQTVDCIKDKYNPGK